MFLRFSITVHSVTLWLYQTAKANVDYFLSQVEEKCVVEIFCEVQMDGLDKAVGETFTKLAFEAVEKIINVSFLKFIRRGQ